jgi:MFS transporter, AAHS family, 4-hydroxybenzoate transporter
MVDSRNVVELIDRQKISWFQLRIVLLGALALALDGFDNQAIAYVAPALKVAWHLRGGALGPVFSAGVIGVGLGSILIGPFADRFGRMRVLLFTVLFFALFSLLIAQARSIGALLLLRFCIGLGLGAVIPLVVVLCNEYAPQRHRAKMVTFMTCGYAIGAAGGGLLTVRLLPVFGWASVFYVGAGMPMLLAVALWFWMPESIRFLTLQAGASARVAAILRQINPELQFGPNTRFHMLTAEHDPATRQNALTQLHELFSEHRAVITMLLWICLFMNLIVLNFLNNWLPTLVIATGLPAPQALRAATALQFGGIFGIVGMGVLADRFGYYKVLAAVFAVGAAVIAVIGLVGASLSGLLATIFIAGFTVIGSQMTLAALSATLYPTRIRATGSSWAFGVGRLCSIVGPLLGGIMITQHWATTTIFYIAAVPMLCAMLVVLAMMRTKRSPARREEFGAPTGETVA